MKSRESFNLSERDKSIRVAIHLVFYFLVFSVSFVNAQSDTLKKLTISGYGELYYCYDFSTPANHQRPDFLYNHKRHNELNANLLLVRAAYADRFYRGNLGLMAGNYPQYNLSKEPEWARFIYEANIGVKLSRKKEFWLDAGIMPSHIGFEGAISADCWTLTRSILAENSPYYEAGVKFSYTSDNEKLILAAYVLNGWQKISRPDFMQRPSFGFQLNYEPDDDWTLNYSNFLGSDLPDSADSFRQYHNFYSQISVGNGVGIVFGFDMGLQRTAQTGNQSWFSPVLILRKDITDRFRIALRGEYYDDRNEVIIETGTADGFRTFGFSSNFDFDINEKIRFRFEGKFYESEDRIFLNDRDKNYSITTNLTFRM